jgi:hypothetical protein
MMARNIQRIEVVVIIFDFRASRHGKAELTEETFNTVDGAGDRMQPPFSIRRPGRETSMVLRPDAFSAALSRSALRAFSACCTCSFASLMTAPAAGRSSGGSSRRVSFEGSDALSYPDIPRGRCPTRQHLMPR